MLSVKKLITYTRKYLSEKQIQKKYVFYSEAQQDD
jgi:hypothetical protein